MALVRSNRTIRVAQKGLRFLPDRADRIKVTADPKSRRHTTPALPRVCVVEPPVGCLLLDSAQGRRARLAVSRSMENWRHTRGERPNMVPFFEGQTNLGATGLAAVLGVIQVVRPLGDAREVEHHERHMPLGTAHRQACQVSAHQEASLGQGGIIRRSRGRFCLGLNRASSCFPSGSSVRQRWPQAGSSGSRLGTARRC